MHPRDKMKSSFIWTRKAHGASSFPIFRSFSFARVSKSFRPAFLANSSVVLKSLRAAFLRPNAAFATARLQ